MPSHSSFRACRLPRPSGAFEPRTLALSVAAVGAIVVSTAEPARAHIKLIEPPSWIVESDRGDPQKQGPCGTSSGTTTDVVTTYRAGQEITVSWQETIGHPGHFRISLSADRADFIDPPVVTDTGDGVTGNSLSAEVMDPIAYPVLADGLFPRATVSGPAAEPFTTTVTLPDEPCESCTLQVTQFMTQHLPGFFYYHCANVRIVAADAELPEDDEMTNAGGSANAASAGAPSAQPVAASSGGSASTMGAVSDEDDSDDGGCSLTSRHPARLSRAITSGLTLIGVAALWRRRRRR